MHNRKLHAFIMALLSGKPDLEFCSACGAWTEDRTCVEMHSQSRDVYYSFEEIGRIGASVSAIEEDAANIRLTEKQAAVIPVLLDQFSESCEEL